MFESYREHETHIRDNKCAFKHALHSAFQYDSTSKIEIYRPIEAYGDEFKPMYLLIIPSLGVQELLSGIRIGKVFRLTI